MRRPVRTSSLSILAGLAFAVSAVSSAIADSTPDRQASTGGLPEYSVKAAFVYNFARFTEWPDGAFRDSASPLRLCVLGQDPFNGALDMIDGKTIRDRELVVSYPIFADEAQYCHILFISESVRGRLPEIVAHLDNSPVLTIGDVPETARSGGIIALENVENRVRFRVNLDAARRSGLRLSSRILDLATSVQSEHLSGPVN